MIRHFQSALLLLGACACLMLAGCGSDKPQATFQASDPIMFIPEGMPFLMRVDVAAIMQVDAIRQSILDGIAEDRDNERIMRQAGIDPATAVSAMAMGVTGTSEDDVQLVMAFKTTANLDRLIEATRDVAGMKVDIDEIESGSNKVYRIRNLENRSNERPDMYATTAGDAILVATSQQLLMRAKDAMNSGVGAFKSANITALLPRINTTRHVWMLGDARSIPGIPVGDAPEGMGMTLDLTGGNLAAAVFLQLSDNAQAATLAKQMNDGLRQYGPMLGMFNPALADAHKGVKITSNSNVVNIDVNFTKAQLEAITAAAQAMR